MRSRNIKPDFFIDEDLSELPFETRLLFIGLWCAADREGRVEDRPKRLKAQVFPFDNVDIDKMLAQLQKSGHIIRYSVDGVKVVLINNFTKHQSPHHTEKGSALPCFNGEAPEDHGEAPEDHESSTVEIPLIPDSGLMIPDSRSLIPDPRLASAKKADLLQGFAEWYAIFPRKEGKKDAEKAWAARKPNEETRQRIMADTAQRATSDQWTKDGGKYCPLPATYIRGERWEDVPLAAQVDGPDPRWKGAL